MTRMTQHEMHQAQVQVDIPLPSQRDSEYGVSSFLFVNFTALRKVHKSDMHSPHSSGRHQQSIREGHLSSWHILSDDRLVDSLTWYFSPDAIISPYSAVLERAASAYTRQLSPSACTLA